MKGTIETIQVADENQPAARHGMVTSLLQLLITGGSPAIDPGTVSGPGLPERARQTRQLNAPNYSSVGKWRRYCVRRAAASPAGSAAGGPTQHLSSPPTRPERPRAGGGRAGRHPSSSNRRLSGGEPSPAGRSVGPRASRHRRTAVDAAPMSETTTAQAANGHEGTLAVTVLEHVITMVRSSRE